MRTNTNMTAAALPASIPQDIHRTYLFIVATTAVTVTISGGTPFTIPVGGHWAPVPAPMNDIAFTGTGTLVTG